VTTDKPVQKHNSMTELIKER